MTEQGLDTDPTARFDPLSEVTRKVRRNLLAWSGVSIAMTWANIIPTKIDAFGFETTHIDQAKMMWLLVCVVLFEGCSFALYGYVETQHWAADPLADIGGSVHPDEEDRIEWRHRVRHPRLRSIVDFWLPLSVGAVAIVSLVFRAIRG